MTPNDPIIEPIRKYREEYAASLGFDMERIGRDLRKREQESGRRVVTRAPRKPDRAWSTQRKMAKSDSTGATD